MPCPSTFSYRAKYHTVPTTGPLRVASSSNAHSTPLHGYPCVLLVPSSSTLTQKDLPSFLDVDFPKHNPRDLLRDCHGHDGDAFSVGPW